MKLTEIICSYSPCRPN